MQEGLLSIVMVNYNHGAFIREALDSVLAQTYPDWELIVVDDGSSDGSLEIIEEYRSRFPGRIRFFCHPQRKNLGITASYRLGIGLCRGEFAGFLEPDDRWEPDNGRRKVDALKQSGAAVVYSDVEPFGDAEVIRLRHSSLSELAKSPSNGPFDAFFSLAVINFIPTFSIIVARTGVLKELRYLDHPQLRMSLDWFLWLQLSLRGTFVFLRQRLVWWRLYRGSYYNQFFLHTPRGKLVSWGLRYRFFILKSLILPFPCGPVRKLKLVAVFLISLARRTLMELRSGT